MVEFQHLIRHFYEDVFGCDVTYSHTQQMTSKFHFLLMHCIARLIMAENIHLFERRFAYHAATDIIYACFTYRVASHLSRSLLNSPKYTYNISIAKKNKIEIYCRLWLITSLQPNRIGRFFQFWKPEPQYRLTQYIRKYSILHGIERETNVLRQCHPAQSARWYFCNVYIMEMMFTKELYFIVHK